MELHLMLVLLIRVQIQSADWLRYMYNIPIINPPYNSVRMRYILVIDFPSFSACTVHRLRMIPSVRRECEISFT